MTGEMTSKRYYILKVVIVADRCDFKGFVDAAELQSAKRGDVSEIIVSVK